MPPSEGASKPGGGGDRPGMEKEGGGVVEGGGAAMEVEVDDTMSPERPLAVPSSLAPPSTLLW